MLALTQNAVQAIDAIIASTSAPDTAGLRISRQATADGEPELAISVAEEPQPDDQVLEPEGEHTPVFIDAAAAPELDNKVLDAQVEGNQVGFMLAEQP
jgi:iron-sulfur cluster assembly protein